MTKRATMQMKLKTQSRIMAKLDTRETPSAHDMANKIALRSSALQYQIIITRLQKTEHITLLRPFFECTDSPREALFIGMCTSLPCAKKKNKGDTSEAASF